MCGLPSRHLAALAAAWGVAASAGAAATRFALAAPYCFTDGRAVVTVPGGARRARWSVRTITDRGWGPSAEAEGAVRDGRVEIAPLAEGIHVVTFSEPEEAEARFLAIDPPRPLERARVAETLPRTWRRLFSGDEYRILAMGDSVAHTGDFEGMLAMMLRRATGNDRVTFKDASYPGRSVDAAVRFFETDAVPYKPHLGLLMYGLNDQICFVPLDGYLEQYEFIARRMADDLGGDTVFMQPTPHIDIPQDPRAEGEELNPPDFAFRTIGFAESLAPVAERLDVPLARTFDAVWGTGAETVQASARAMWPRYPPGYSEQMRSMLETDGRGDTIHPNALGHLAIAKAVLRAIAGGPDATPLAITGRTEWQETSVTSRYTVTNVSGARRTGRIEVYPPFEDFVLAEDRPYDLAPGEAIEIEVDWPRVWGPRDLLRHPANIYLAPGAPRVPVVDFSGGASRVHAPAAPAVPDAAFVRGRQSVEGRTVIVGLRVGGDVQTRVVAIPAGPGVGRVPLVERVEVGGEAGWAVAELAYCRYASALRGEAGTDGRLDEWRGHAWSPVGEPCQARFVRGPEDNRAAPEECYLLWAFRAGAAGVHLAARASGDVSRDRFVVFFDARAPESLGSAGRYYWVSGAVKPNGKMTLGRGETSSHDEGLAGRWTREGEETTLELFVPYELFDLDEWPQSGDLGLSIWWTHVGADGMATNLMWSEDGHPWNTRWYGVARLQARADESALPYVVRVK